ncbi:zinc-binding dehydrogenase [Streptomyces sp. NBC_01235]|uniref:zinc-binding dehydrogenase n=1 Tax=Streptomyces sp. NBC_01235 TaxID=2903788 RepID=UPI002E0DA15A|nr:zinc-binding dehydrogenase [Streptomyces sp. NBC_01235]
MRAAQVKAFGGPEVLGTVDLPDPVAGPGEVLIEVAHADTIFVETQVRAGRFRAYFPVEPPYVPGGGVSGTVSEVGAGVDAGWVGRRVTSFVNGSYAERVTAPVTALTPVPGELDLRTAAALVHDGVTAAGLLERTAVAPGDRVLILGASGGMGTLLIQLARARGARVLAAARGAQKLALVRDLGAHAVVDVSDAGWVERAREALGNLGEPTASPTATEPAEPTEPAGRAEPTEPAERAEPAGFAERAEPAGRAGRAESAEPTGRAEPAEPAERAEPAGFAEPARRAGRAGRAESAESADVVLDGVGGELELRAFPLVADGGRFSAHGAPSGGFAEVDGTEAGRRNVTLLGIGDVRFGEDEVRRLTAYVLEEAAAGRLRPMVGAEFPLTEAAAAHAAIEGREVVGKVVLRA